MEKVYGITGVKFTAISDSGGPATLKALLDGKVDVANIYSTTPSILANKLVTLEDPKNMIAAQNVVPLINSDKATDEVKEVLNGISAELTTRGPARPEQQEPGRRQGRPGRAGQAVARRQGAGLTSSQTNRRG